MTDRDPDAHRYSVEKMFPRLGETDTTDNVLKLLNEAPAISPMQAGSAVHGGC
jgi:hypothetical protein